MRVKILLLLLLASWAACGICPSNSYIEARNSFGGKRNKITLLSRPRMSKRRICGTEWERHGTCCSVRSLKRNVKLDEATTKKTWERLVRLYDFFNSASQSLFHKLAEVAVVPLTKDRKANARVRAARSILADINNVNSLHLGYEGNFEADTEKCWKYVQKLRTASVCSMCSGSAANFFSRNKGLSLTRYCDSALQHCYRSLKVNGRLMKLLLWTIGADEELKPTGVSIRQGKKGLYNMRSAIRQARKKLPGYYRDFIRDGMPELLQRLSNSHRSNNKALNVAICDKFLNLAHKPFISYFTDTVYGDGGKFYKVMGNIFGYHKIYVNMNWRTRRLVKKHRKYIRAHVEAYKRRLRAQLADWKAGATDRRLGLDQGASFSFITSDVAYLDFSGTGMGDMMTVQQHRRPMNLSLAFP